MHKLNDILLFNGLLLFISVEYSPIIWRLDNPNRLNIFKKNVICHIAYLASKSINHIHRKFCKILSNIITLVTIFPFYMSWTYTNQIHEIVRKSTNPLSVDIRLCYSKWIFAEEGDM